MELKSPIKEKSISLLANQPIPPLETPTKLTTTAIQSPNIPQSLKSSPQVPEFITIPSFSRWFSWEKIYESERRFLPEFFDGKSSTKNDRVYMYYRNSIIKLFRENPSKKITFTQARKVLVGDVGSIRRVFDFLETWGLINYTGMGLRPQSKLDNKENKSGDMIRKDSSSRFCSGCKALCSIACFVCDKVDMTLCARCYVRGEYRGNVTSSDDFRRVEISEQTKTEWSDKETLHLLEAVMHFGEDWKKVAEHVACGRTERECVARFLKLPFKEQFINPSDFDGVDKYYDMREESEERGSSPSSPKKRRLTPFADTSNPIMAQVAFLSAMAGSEVAKAAARAAVKAVSGSSPLEDGVAEAEACIHKEEEDMEKAITNIAQVQMKEFEDKIVHFEEVEMEMEKEWKQLQYMKSLIFTDQLTLLFQKGTAAKMGESKIASNLPT